MRRSTQGTPGPASATTSLLPIAVRAYAVPRATGTATDRGNKRGKRSQRKRLVQLIGAGLALVFDCETTTDPSQRLLFGNWRVYGNGRCIDEGLIYADDLPTQDRSTLEAYARTHVGATEAPQGKRLRLLSQREFLHRVIWPVAYKARGLVVGFNLPFDLTRLAASWSIARHDPYAGGFSLVLWEYERDGVRREDRYRPRITLKSIDSKRTLIGFTRPHSPDTVDQIPEGSHSGRPDPAYTFRGHFLDLRTLAFALTNKSYSLERACNDFGVTDGKGHVRQHGVITPEYIDYNRQDVAATWGLFQKLREEYTRHPIGLPMTRAYSPASIGKAYLSAMGIPPILERQGEFTVGFPGEYLGYAMVAYYGGRAEARIRKLPVPVVYLDFLSMYPTVCTLMDLWKLLTAKQIEAVNATQEVRALLDAVTLDACFRPGQWKQFVGLAQIVPHGDVLPVRARYGGEASWQIGVNPLSATEPLWYTIPDVVASTLQTGKPPHVVRAVRFVPSGRRRGLQTVLLRGVLSVDPRTHDFFRHVIEERKRLQRRADLSPQEREQLDPFLKVLANSTSYGIFAEMNRQEGRAKERVDVDVYGAEAEPFSAEVTAPEEPCAYCFPPISACIAGAARLMLTLLERSVADLGGAYAMCDTDSMAIVATQEGGLIACPGGPHQLKGKAAIQALPWAKVETIRARFAALNPYDPDAIAGSVLKIEKENFDPNTEEQRQLWCYAISAKRYALFTLDEQGHPHLVKWSEHGLGHLLNPTDPDSEDRDWIRQLWDGIVHEELGLPYTWPTWLDRPAIGRITASSPTLLVPFEELNRDKPYTEQVKPANFLLSAHVAPLGLPPGVDGSRFHLIAPYESDSRKWLQLPWTDRYSGKRFSITTASTLYATSAVGVKTYRDVLDQYRNHVEAKSLGPDGGHCRGTTMGLLQRRPVTAQWVTHVGKESNKLEEVEAGLVHDPEEVYTEYINARRDPAWAIIAQVLKDMPRSRLMHETGLSRRALTALRNGHALPHPKTREALARSASAFAREQLSHAGIAAPRDHLSACIRYLNEPGLAVQSQDETSRAPKPAVAAPYLVPSCAPLVLLGLRPLR